MSERFTEFYQRSIKDRDSFWAEQAELIEWRQKPTQICDYSNPPFAKWFVGGTTNLCHNAVDRHLAVRGEQNALIAISTETNTEKAYSYQELHAEADPEERDLVLSRIVCSQDHAFGSSSAEAAWYQDSVYAVKSLVQVFLIEFFGINPGDLYFCLACDSAVLQGFYDA